MADAEEEKAPRFITEEADTTDTKPESVVSLEPTMSKNQRKRFLKHQRYLENKKIKKLRKKEKKKELQELRKNETTEKRSDRQIDQPVKKWRRMESPSASPLRVAIDLSFDDLMREHDVKKLVKQVQRCYAVNRRAEHPLQLYLTSFGGQSQETLDDTGGHYRSWDIHIRTEGLTEAFSKDDIIYLTSESPNVLRTLDTSKVYVIGGLVDHNHHKGLCYRQAVERGLGHAQLPIGEYVKLNSRKVLTVNHVFEILVQFTESQDWKDAFFKVLPARKVEGETEGKEEENEKKCGRNDLNSTEEKNEWH